MDYQELIGKRFGYWTVMKVGRKENGMQSLVCRCDCGNEGEPQYYALRDGRSKSCGCLQIRVATSHGHCPGKNGSKTYMAWSQMKSRCDNSNHKDYRDYGGRGITYIKEWKRFESFLTDMGEAPAGLTLDRVDNLLGYFPGNCRWADRKTQQNNRRNTVMYTYQGATKPRQIWCDQFNISSYTVSNRLKRGWDIEKALTYPVDLSKSSTRKFLGVQS